MINHVNTNTLPNINKSQPSFKGLYNNKILLNGLKLASENSALFSAGTALSLSLVARPVAILSTPKTEKENKKIACVKSVASSFVGYLIMLGASLPVAKAVKNIDCKPSDFLKKSTINFLKDNEKRLVDSKKYMFVTQLFKLGVGVVMAFPKSVLTCALIPPLLNTIFPKQEVLKQQPHKFKRSNSKAISFKGLYDKSAKRLAVGIGKIIDTSFIQKATEKFSETNYAQHIMNFTDVILTYSFVKQTQKSKNIKEERKQALIHNSIISTGLSIVGGYIVNKALNKPTENFINKFKSVNENLPDLEKYVEGIKIAKPALILGCIYYILIPVFSTFFADRTSSYLKQQVK